MDGIKPAPKVKVLPSNSNGNDYIVGDLHGMLTELLVVLEHVGFDNSKDRLFSVGDLIDRGPQSLELLREFMVRDNWYFVKGNHEDMMIQSLIFDADNIFTLWLSNGGSWIFKENMDELKDAAIWMAENIPTIMVVGENENRFNICHAELIKQCLIGEVFPLVENETIEVWDFTANEEEQIIWGRNIYQDYRDDYFINDNPFKYHSEKLSITYVGHTPHFLPEHNETELYKMLQLEKHVYMDTGACFIKHERYKDDALLSVLNHTTQQTYFLDKDGNIIEGVL